MTDSQRKDVDANRTASDTSGMYVLLARLWSMEVDQTLTQQLNATELGPVYEAAGGQIPDEAELEELAAVYCQLFVGPRGHYPPLQSVWARGELQSEVTSSVQSFGDAIGWSRNPSYPDTMADHLGVELDIMARAVQHYSSSGDPEAFALASTFFRRHLTWAEGYIDTIQARTENPFYVAMFRMTQEFLAVESEFWLDVQAAATGQHD